MGPTTRAFSFFMEREWSFSKRANARSSLGIGLRDQNLDPMRLSNDKLCPNEAEMTDCISQTERFLGVSVASITICLSWRMCRMSGSAVLGGPHRSNERLRARDNGDMNREDSTIESCQSRPFSHYVIVQLNTGRIVDEYGSAEVETQRGTRRYAKHK